MDSYTVYLLHFTQRYKHAGHSRGSSHNLTKRLQAHAKGRGPGSWQSSMPPGSLGPSHAPGKEEDTVNDNLNARAGHTAAVRSAKAWGLSLAEWLAYERDMDSLD